MFRAISQEATQKEHWSKNLQISQKKEAATGGIL